MATLLYYSMVLVFLNYPAILTSTGPDCTYYSISPKLKESTERIESFSGLFESRYLATNFFGSESSLYYYIFFLVSLLQNPMSIITFQYMKFIPDCTFYQIFVQL